MIKYKRGDKMNNEELYPKVFTWLGVGLLITFISAYMLSLNTELLIKTLSFGAIPMLILELVIAFGLGIFIQKMSPMMAKICYILYSIITGISFSTIFISYKISSVISVFAISSVIFGGLALYGYITKKDLSKFGTIFIFVLLGIIIGELLNVLIFKSPAAEILFSVLGVLIFAGYIAYDVNQIKYMLPSLGEEKTAIYGAFQLYLDFINLFIRLLELFGKSDN